MCQRQMCAWVHAGGALAVAPDTVGAAPATPVKAAGMARVGMSPGGDGVGSPGERRNVSGVEHGEAELLHGVGFRQRRR